MYFVSILFVGFSVFLLANLLFRLSESYRAQKAFLDRPSRLFDSILLRTFWPLIEFIAPHLEKSRFIVCADYISERLAEAGFQEKLKVREFCAFQLIMVVLCALLTILIPVPLSPVLIFLAAVFGYFYTIIWLRGFKKAREREIRYSLPFLLDLLMLSVEAGLDFISAVDRVVERCQKSLLTEEFRRMLGQIRLGKTRGEAFRELKQRLRSPAVDSLVTMLVQAEELGASIGPVLRAHASKLRNERFFAAERAGAIAAQKLLIPLIFCIMPAVFILIFGPIVVMWRNGVLKY